MSGHTKSTLPTRSIKLLTSSTFIGFYRRHTLKLFLNARSRSKRSFYTQVSSSSTLRPSLSISFFANHSHFQKITINLSKK